MCICASWHIGCLANTKGIPGISLKYAMVLGVTVGAAAPLPLQPAVPGVAGSAKAPVPEAIVTCSTLSKK